MSNKVTINGINTSTLKTMKKEETIKLLKEYKLTKDENVKDKIIIGNLKLIFSVLKKTKTTTTLDANDLFQIGIIGLIKAIDNFNLDLDLYFSTYAIPMILGEIRRYIRDNSTLKISRQIKDNAYKILKFKEEYLLKYNSEPDITIISKSLELSEYDISEALSSINSVCSIDDSVYNDNGDTLHYIDHLKDESQNVEKMINKITLNAGINKLDTIKQKIILKRYYKGLTQEEIANELFISQAQVSRLEKTALSELRKLF